MPITPPIGESALSYTCLDIITDALIEVGILSPGEQANLDPDTAQWAFRKFNYVIDVLQATEKWAYSYQFNIFTLVAQLQPHTIGPSGMATFSTNGQPRPVKIKSATQLLNAGVAGGPVDLIINVTRDRQWWADQQVKNIQTNVVTDLYYDPTFPDGSLYFWPVPNAQNQVRLEYWQQVAQFEQIDDPIGGPGGPGTLPPGYRAALMYTLAENLLSSAALEEHPALARAAQLARAAVFSNNSKSPKISTRDSGMPHVGRRSGVRADFNWATGGAPGGAPE